MDIYPMTVMFYLYQQNVLHWFERAGKNSFKLEDGADRGKIVLW